MVNFRLEQMEHGLIYISENLKSYNYLCRGLKDTIEYFKGTVDELAQNPRQGVF